MTFHAIIISQFFNIFVHNLDMHAQNLPIMLRQILNGIVIALGDINFDAPSFVGAELPDEWIIAVEFYGHIY